MDRSEFKIGEVFQFGNIKLRVDVGKPGKCAGCLLFDIVEGPCQRFFEVVGHCQAMYRKDKTDVIFVKVEE